MPFDSNYVQSILDKSKPELFSKKPNIFISDKALTVLNISIFVINIAFLIRWVFISQIPLILFYLFLYFLLSKWKKTFAPGLKALILTISLLSTGVLWLLSYIICFYRCDRDIAYQANILMPACIIIIVLAEIRNIQYIRLALNLTFLLMLGIIAGYS